ncbi:2-phospho-L-lactate guanylyltransferase [Streptomyces sp. NPDC090301]|uniref:2-phospho-L-lactate guanylyltransferase n=1 Tax=Streptomyces sp. NPDC090301 TaxID=3154975 RepID=UPI00344007AA
MSASGGWTVLLPVKPFPFAKSRLAAWAGDSRTDWARAFFLDTLRSVSRTPEVSRIVVVTADPSARDLAGERGAECVEELSPRGLNSAVRAGAARASVRGARTVAVLTADLPALRSEELTRVLDAAAGHRRAFLTDHTGIGTTVLTARVPTLLTPRFEGASRQRHAASGAVELDVAEVPGARLDIDTPDDLVAARALGLGPYSCAVDDRRRGAFSFKGDV